MNILVTLNKNYIKYLVSLVRSINENDSSALDIYIISNDIEMKDLEPRFEKNGRNNFHVFSFDESLLNDVPTSKRYPKSIYYRIFASLVLPKDIDKILYLDPDIIVISSLYELYSMEFEDNYFIATTNVGKFLQKFNNLKNNSIEGAPYINTGVMLMNLKLLREKQDMEEVSRFIEKNSFKFTLPDQDIINGLYGDKIIIIDKLIYNISDRSITLYNLKHKDKIDLEWVQNNSKIIHYYGRNKPWKDKYKGILKPYYDKYKEEE